MVKEILAAHMIINKANINFLNKGFDYVVESCSSKPCNNKRYVPSLVATYDKKDLFYAQKKKNKRRNGLSGFRSYDVNSDIFNNYVRRYRRNL